MTFLWNPVCHDHKVKVMKGDHLNGSIINLSNHHYHGGDMLSCTLARLLGLRIRMKTVFLQIALMSTPAIERLKSSTGKVSH